jgi:hypothetical protein
MAESDEDDLGMPGSPAADLTTWAELLAAVAERLASHNRERQNVHEQIIRNQQDGLEADSDEQVELMARHRDLSARVEATLDEIVEVVLTRMRR